MATYSLEVIAHRIAQDVNHRWLTWTDGQWSIDHLALETVILAALLDAVKETESRMTLGRKRLKAGTGCQMHTHYEGCGCTLNQLCCGCLPAVYETDDDDRSPHTPGPWTANLAGAQGNHAGSFSVEAWIDGVGPVVICGRMGWPNHAAESHANALILAAAPDLLAALKEVCRFLPDAEFALASAAIAKAEGR